MPLDPTRKKPAEDKKKEREGIWQVATVDESRIKKVPVQQPEGGFRIKRIFEDDHYIIFRGKDGDDAKRTLIINKDKSEVWHVWTDAADTHENKIVAAYHLAELPTQLPKEGPNADPKLASLIEVADRVITGTTNFFTPQSSNYFNIQNMITNGKNKDSDAFLQRQTALDDILKLADAKQTIDDLLADAKARKNPPVAVIGEQGKSPTAVLVSGETPKICENSVESLNKVSPPYGNQNITVEKKNMATDLSKTKEETARIVKTTPTVFAICAGEGGSKCGINEFLPLAGPLVKKRVDPNNEYDVAAFAAMIQVPIKEAKSIAEKTTTNMLFRAVNEDGLDLRLLVTDFTGKLQLDRTNADAYVQLSESGLVGQNRTLAKSGKPVDQSLARAEAMILSPQVYVDTSNFLPIGQAYMLGFEVKPKEVYDIPETVRKFLKTEEIKDGNGKVIAVRFKGKIEDSSSKLVTGPIKYRLEGKDENAKLVESNLGIVWLVNACGGGSGGAITDGFAEHLNLMRIDGYRKAGKTRAGAEFAVYKAGLYPADQSKEDYFSNTAIRILEAINAGRLIGMQQKLEDRLQAIDGDVLITRKGFTAAHLKEEDEHIIENVDKTLAEYVMNLSNTLVGSVCASGGLSEQKPEEISGDVYGRIIAGVYHHKNGGRPKELKAILDEVRKLAKPVALDADGMPNGLLVGKGPSIFTDEWAREEPADYVDAIINTLETVAKIDPTTGKAQDIDALLNLSPELVFNLSDKKDGNDKRIPQEAVPLEFLTPTSVYIFMNGKDIAKTYSQLEGAVIAKAAEMLWPRAKNNIRIVAAPGKTETTSVALSGYATITPEDLHFLRKGLQKMYHATYNDKAFIDAFVNGNEESIDNILRYDAKLKRHEEPFESRNPPAGFAVLQKYALQEAKAQNRLLPAEVVVENLKHIYTAVWHPERLYKLYGKKPAPQAEETMAPETVVAPEPEYFGEKTKQSILGNIWSGMKKYGASIKDKFKGGN